MNAPPPPPPPPAPKRRSRLAAGLIVGLLIVVAALVPWTIYTWLRSDPIETSASSRSLIPSPPSSPTPTHVPQRQRPQVAEVFSDQDWARGRNWLLYVADFDPDSDCSSHTFTSGGKTLTAYRSGCSSWEDDGTDILIFYVALRNTTNEARTFHLDDFVVVARDRAFVRFGQREIAGRGAAELPS